MVWKVCRCVSCDIVSCFFLLTNLLEYLRVGSFSFSGVVGDPTQAGKNKTHVTFSHGKKKKKHKSSIGSWAYSSYLSRITKRYLKLANTVRREQIESEIGETLKTIIL